MPELIPFVPDALTLVAVTGLGALLGKIWANRVSAREDTKIQSELASLRTDLERSLHVHRVQFEKEFEVYAELSEKMVAVREALFTINRALKTEFEDKGKEEKHYASLNQKLKDAFVDFRATVQKKKPFYADAVFIAADRILELALDEIVTQDYSSSGQRQPLNRIIEMKRQISENTEALVQAIRDRINLLKVVN